MTCLTCPADLTLEDDPEPFPTSIDINYFQLKFLQNLLSLPQNSIPNFLHIFQNSSFCSTCASDLFNVIQSLREIDILQEKVTEFKESFQTKLVQGFQEGSFQNQFPFKIEPEVLEFKLKLITDLNLLPSQVEEEVDLDNFGQPLENLEECHNSNQPGSEDTSSPEYVPSSQSDAEDDTSSSEPNEPEFDNNDPVSYSSKTPPKLKELIIPLQRLDHPTSHNNIKLKAKSQPKRKSLKKKSKDLATGSLLPNWVHCTFPNCSYKTRSSTGIYIHGNKIHNITKQIQCSKCPQSFYTEAKLNTHLEKCHPKDGLICEICATKFNTARGLNDHMKTAHEERSIIPCKYCDHMFKTKQGLNTHLRVFHTGERLIPCLECDRKFANKALLTGHVQFEHRKERTPCPQLGCSRTFACKYSISKHLNIDHGIGPQKRYDCPICGKSFRRSHALIRHKEIHRPEKMYICELCSKRFATKSNLDQHQKVGSCKEANREKLKS